MMVKKSLVSRYWWSITVTTALVLSFNVERKVQVGAFTSPKGVSLPSRRRNRLTVFATATNTNTRNTPTEIVYGLPVGEVFSPKFLDGVKFNLFGIGRQDDEDRKHGAYQPPPHSMDGTVCVITGASSGLGLESAKRLALAGAYVILTARTHEKVNRSVNAVLEYCKSGQQGQYINATPIVKGVMLDLDDFSTVRSFPDRYRKCLLREGGVLTLVDVLMNNAGGGGYPMRELTVDGYEKTFQSNHLGHFLLTARLLEERLLNQEEGGCTVINVSSVTHRCAEAHHFEEEGTVLAQRSQKEIEYGYDFNNMNCEIVYTSEAYFQAKLANILFTRELQRRADMQQEHQGNGRKSWLTAVSLEPGGVTTDIWRYSFGYDPRTLKARLAKGEKLEQPENNRNWKYKLIAQIFYKMTTRVERGANVQVWLAYLHSASECEEYEIIGGQHYDEYRKIRAVPEYADSEDTGKKLWELSEKMTDIKFNF